MVCACKREERGFKVQPPSADTIQTLKLSELSPGPTPTEIATNLSTNSPPTNAPATNANTVVSNTPSQIATNATNTGSTNQVSTNSAVTNASGTNLITTNSLSTNKLPSVGASQARPVKNSYEENAYALSEGKRLYNSFNCVGCHAHGGGGMGPPLMDDQWLYGSAPEQVFASIVEGRPNGMPAFRDHIPDYQVWQLAAYVRSLSGLVKKDAATSRDDHISGKKPENSTDRKEPKNSSLPKSGEMPL